MSAARRIGITALLVVMGAVPAGCSQEEPQGFTADNRNGFLAACIDPLQDSRLTSSICQCVFDETQTRLSFQRFEQIEELLTAESEVEIELPDELVEIIATCVIETAEL